MDLGSLLFPPNLESSNSSSLTKNLPPPILENMSACYPTGTSAAQYLVGYGSLMQKASKERTYPRTGEVSYFINFVSLQRFKCNLLN